MDTKKCYQGRQNGRVYVCIILVIKGQVDKRKHKKILPLSQQVNKVDKNVQNSGIGAEVDKEKNIGQMYNAIWLLNNYW